MKKYYKEVYKAMSVSKFRHPDNYIPSLLYIDSMKYAGYGIPSNRIYNKSEYVAVSSKTNFEKYNNCEMICFNDTASVDNFYICQNNLLVFLNKKLPNRSGFELTDQKKVPTEYLGIYKETKQYIGRKNAYLYF